MTQDRDIRDLTQRTPLADAEDVTACIHSEPAVPPMLPRESGIAKVLKNYGGGRYQITQQVGDGSGGLQNATAAEGFVGQEAQEVWRRDTAEVGDYVLFEWVRESNGARSLHILIIVESEESLEGEFKEYSISGIKGCRSVVVNRLGKVIGGYDRNGNWSPIAGHDAPASTIFVDLGEA